MNKVNIHTVFLTIGQPISDKTIFCKNVLSKCLEKECLDNGYKPNIQYISYDDCGKELLNDSNNSEERIAQISNLTLEYLFTKLRLMISYPINADFVIIDSTSFSQEFINKIVKITKDNMYNISCIIFDYINEQPSIKNIDQKIVINKITTIDNFSLTIKNLNDYVERLLPTDRNYFIVGDIHECFDELKELLTSVGFKIENGYICLTEKTETTDIILVGDIFDKGWSKMFVNNEIDDGNILENFNKYVKFINRNIDNPNGVKLYIIRGNHEAFIHDYLNKKNKIKNENFINKHFSSVRIFEQDEDLKKMFEYIWNNGKEFFIKGGSNRHFIVSHVPCRKKYLGKMDKKSLQKQQYIYIDHNKRIAPQIEFIKEETEYNHPIHIFGHVALKREYYNDDHICLDTGCINGNKLTGLLFKTKFVEPLYYSVNFLGLVDEIKEDLETFRSYEKINKLLAKLSNYQLDRIKYIIDNKINFISGTISSTDKTNELESLKKGLEYYINNGVQYISMQPKYMGNRCQIYLSTDLEKCYAVSRCGYKINIDLTQVYINLLKKMNDFIKENNIKMIIIDGELMLWKALGNKIKLYNMDEPIHFKPFNILKWIDNDNKNLIPNMSVIDIFKLVSLDEQLVLFLDDPEYLTKGNAYYNKLVGQGMGGVILKPIVENINNVNIAPYLKVKNVNHLGPIYGYNYTFPIKHNKLIKQKDIEKKIKASVIEYNLGQTMLQFNLDDINNENDDYKLLIAEFLFEKEIE